VGTKSGASCHQIRLLILKKEERTVTDQGSAAFSLNRQLAEQKAKSRSRLPPDVVAAMQDANAELLSLGIPDRCLKEGGEAPDFALQNARGRTVKLSELLVRGPVVVAFYRGAW
jgi:hypothetical protein